MNSIVPSFSGCFQHDMYFHISVKSSSLLMNNNNINSCKKKNINNNNNNFLRHVVGPNVKRLK